MASNPRSSAGAVVLATALTFEPQPVDRFALHVPAIRRVLQSARGPLNLDAAIYRYRIVDGLKPFPQDTPAAGRFCSHRERGRRRR